jgi:hypothetical protein
VRSTRLNVDNDPVIGTDKVKSFRPELSSEDFAELKKEHNSFGWLVFAAQEQDLPTERIEEDGPTASERLRKRMFVYWKAKVNEGDFDTWRKQQLEMIEQEFLDRLN